MSRQDDYVVSKLVKTRKNRRSIIVLMLVLIMAAMVLGFWSLTHPGENGNNLLDSLGGKNQELPKLPTAVSTPGVVIYGYVRDENARGIENVAIYRNFASYPGVNIAQTDANGFYQSDFSYIPGDEMITVWAEQEGMTFDPEQYYWRHYHGYEITEIDFTSQNPWEAFFPIIVK